MNINDFQYEIFESEEILFLTKQDYVIALFINSDSETEYNIYDKEELSQNNELLDSDYLSENIDDFSVIDGGVISSILSKEEINTFINDLDLNIYYKQREF